MSVKREMLDEAATVRPPDGARAVLLGPTSATPILSSGVRPLGTASRSEPDEAVALPSLDPSALRPAKVPRDLPAEPSHAEVVPQEAAPPLQPSVATRVVLGVLSLVVLGWLLTLVALLAAHLASR